MAIKVKAAAYPHIREVSLGGTQGQILTRTDANGAYGWQDIQATTDYEDLENKPKINNVILSGNKSLDDLDAQQKLVSGTTIKTVNGNDLLGSGDITISSAVAWGNITGTITNQNDLNNTFLKIADQKTATSQLTNDSGFITKEVSNLTNYTDNSTLGGLLDAKANTNDLKAVAFSGSYTDLSNQPSIPTKTSDIINDSGFINKGVNDLTNYTNNTALNILLNNKQDELVSGQNIKTINHTSVLGEGDISITATATWGNIDGTLTDQTDLTNALNSKQATLIGTQTSGQNIKTIDGASILGSGNINSKVTSVNTLTGDVVLTQDNVGDGTTYVRTHNDFTTAKSNQIATNAQNIATNTQNITTNTGNISTNTNSITAINAKIPNEASSSNKLADKNFVNSSIASSTGTFRGTVETTTELEALTGSVNDYAFYKHVDAYGNTLFDRFKYVDPVPTTGVHYGHWLYEYTLNNSSFTAAQWAAINSGATDVIISNFNTHLSDTNNPHSVNKTQVGLGNVVNTGDSDTPVSGGTTKFTTGGAYTELAKKQDNLPQVVNDRYLHTNATTGALEWSTVSQGEIYTAGQGIDITNRVISTDLTENEIPNLSASKITSGTFDSARIPDISLSKITDVTATAEEVNVLDGIIANTTELNYTKGVLSSIQGQLDNRVIKNNNITAGTATKITYDAKGLVTAGSTLSASDIPSLDASKITSGTFADARIASASTWNNKSTVSVSATGTATDEVQYITINGTEKKLAGGGGGTWGSITGTLSNQTDLQDALDAKQPTIAIRRI